jgi:DnaK suppressor protein
VSNEKTRFDQSFLETKRRQLMELRDKLLATRGMEQVEETDIKSSSNSEAREYEDDAQKLTTLELEGNLEVRDTARLANIGRALRKIEEGSYGISDASGEPIPVERLNAVPEAIYTLAEQSAQEVNRG